MKRPYVICHMASTVDGRILAEHWGKELDKFGSAYEACHESFNSQAWMVGRVTMEKDFTEGKTPELKTPETPIPRMHFIGDKSASSFAIAVDPGGKLGWERNEIDGDHVIEILTESVSDEYLNHLRSVNISYLFAGKDAVDFKLALEQLSTLFGIHTLMLEGGGSINGSLLHAGLINELSILILPLADGSSKTPTTFELSHYLKRDTATSLRLKEVERLDGDVVWLRYEVK